MRSDKANRILEKLARESGQQAWRLAYALVRNRADAEDVVQQSFLIAARKVEKIPSRNPWPWFAKVVTFEARNARRKRKGVELNAEAEGKTMHEQAPDHGIVERERNAKLETELERLDQTQREAILLTHFTGLSYREAAKAMGMPTGTVKSHVNRGIAQLRTRMGATESTVISGIAALPIVEPASGLSNALASWLTSAQASVISAGVTSGSLVIGGIVMSQKVVAACTLAIGIAAGFGGSVIVGELKDNPQNNTTLNVAHNTEEPESSTSKNTGVNEKLYAEVRKERDDYKKRLSTLVKELDTTRAQLELLATNHAASPRPGSTETTVTPNTSETPETVKASPSTPSPTFERWTYEGADKVDWSNGAKVVLEMTELFAPLIEAQLEGDEIEDDAVFFEKMAPIGMKMMRFNREIRDAFADDKDPQSHPYVIANLLSNLLEEAGMALSASQVSQIESLGLTYDENLEQKKAQYSSQTFELEKVLDECLLKDAFLTNAKTVLTTQQRDHLYGEDLSNQFNAEMLGSGTSALRKSLPLQGTSLQALQDDLSKSVKEEWELASTNGSGLDFLVDNWFQNIAHKIKQIQPPEESAENMGGGGSSLSIVAKMQISDKQQDYSDDELFALVHTQLTAMKDIYNTVSMTDKERDAIRSSTWVFLPYHEVESNNNE